MKRIWRLMLVVAILLQSSSLLAKESTQDEAAATYAAQAAELLAQMSPAERVGQLFLVTFEGTDTGSESEIARLITQYHIGGVVLLASNDNIAAPEATSDFSTPHQIAALTNELQRLSITGQGTAVIPPQPEDDEVAVPIIESTPTPLPPEQAIPLFIATHHMGDGQSEILSGLTETPSQMALGATWQTEKAQAVGSVVGTELAALGINMLFGPALDVLNSPPAAAASQANFGTNFFGGDPFWVAQMGQAYVEGVHTGSNGRLAVIVSHFPGSGSSDRPLNQEIPTVRKSLDELLRTELRPFAAVASTDSTAAEGFMTAHVRYQGFQGNIRPSTAPLSFDPKALETLLQLPQFANWRLNGGLLVSGPLGVRAVERFYDDTGSEFPHRTVAKDALLAGNDLLYLENFALGNEAAEVQAANIEDTARWFVDKYNTDQAFKQRVDTAVLRSLQLKLRLYNGNFSLNNVQVDPSTLDDKLGQGQGIMFDVAQSAITLLSPAPEDLLERLPGPPPTSANIVIFTDLVPQQQCSTCPVQPRIGMRDLEERMLALYGPEASGQVQASQIQSFSFTDLARFLNRPSPILPPATATPLPTPEPDATLTPTPDALLPTPTAEPPSPFAVQEAVTQADWIIFALLDVDATTSASALKEFLARRPDLVREAEVIVFAFESPTYLDSTEVSQLTAYFGVYSSTSSFIDAAVRAIFRDLPVRGAAPISIAGVGYDVVAVTKPTPDQVIELFIEEDESQRDLPADEPIPLSPGDTLRLMTDVIIDFNGNPVPDGTIVQFTQHDRIQGFFNVIGEVPTVKGSASFDYVLPAQPGQFRLTAAAGQANVSSEINIAIGENVEVEVATPTPAPTQQAVEAPTAEATLAATDTPPPPASPTTLLPPEAAEPTVNIPLSEAWMLLAMGSGLGLNVVLGALWTRRLRLPTAAHKLRLILWGIIGALVLYIYYALGLPGAAILLTWGSWAGLITTLAGGLSAMVLYKFYGRWA